MIDSFFSATSSEPGKDGRTPIDAHVCELQRAQRGQKGSRTGSGSRDNHPPPTRGLPTDSEPTGEVTARAEPRRRATGGAGFCPAQTTVERTDPEPTGEVAAKADGTPRARVGEGKSLPYLDTIETSQLLNIFVNC